MHDIWRSSTLTGLFPGVAFDHDDDGLLVQAGAQVHLDGRLIHQHQSHVGKYGGERDFPNDWIEVPGCESSLMNRDTQFESEVRDLATEVLADFSAQLNKAGLRVDITVSGWPDKSSDTSELRVKFWRGNDFVDWLETFVIQDVKRAGTLDQYRQWLAEYVPAILAEDAGDSDG